MVSYQYIPVRLPSCVHDIGCRSLGIHEWETLGIKAYRKKPGKNYLVTKRLCIALLLPGSAVHHAGRHPGCWSSCVSAKSCIPANDMAGDRNTMLQQDKNHPMLF